MTTDILLHRIGAATLLLSWALGLSGYANWGRVQIVALAFLVAAVWLQQRRLGNPFRRSLTTRVEDALWRLDRARLRRVARRRLMAMKREDAERAKHDSIRTLARDTARYYGAGVEQVRRQVAHVDHYTPDRRDRREA